MPERQALRRNLPVPLLVKFRRCSSLGQCGYPILWVVALDYGPPFYKKCPVLFKNWCNLVKQSNTSYPVHDQDLCAKWTKANPRRLYVPYVPSSHSLSTRALHTIVDGYALHCRRYKVMYSLRSGQTAMPFGKTDGMAPGFRRRLHRWSETTSFRFVFAQCCYPYVHSRCEKDMKVVVALSSF